MAGGLVSPVASPGMVSPTAQTPLMPVNRSDAGCVALRHAPAVAYMPGSAEERVGDGKDRLKSIESGTGAAGSC